MITSAQSIILIALLTYSVISIGQTHRITFDSFMTHRESIDRKLFIIGEQAAPEIQNGLYHYLSYFHALEKRRSFDSVLWNTLEKQIGRRRVYRNG